MPDVSFTKHNDIVYASFILHATGLTPIGKPTYEQWREVGRFIKKTENSVHFWIGDWLNYGERRYGEMYLQAIVDTGFEYAILKKDKYIASKIELGLRSPNLTPSHARQIAPLPPLERRYWAEKLKSVPLSVRDL